MKKLLACGLILTMLSSTGAMCFANPETVNTIQGSATDVVVNGESQDNEPSQEELISHIETIKNDKSLTVKERFEKAWDSVKEFVETSIRPEGKLAKAWNYVKNFVKEHYIAVSGVTAAVVISLLVWLCGPTVVDALQKLFSPNREEQPKKEVVEKKEKQVIIENEEKQKQPEVKKENDEDMESNELFASVWNEL